MERTIKTHFHTVVVFTKPTEENGKVGMYRYLAPKVFMARDWFEEDHPDKKILKLFSIGVSQHEIDGDKYNALHKVPPPV
jgi:hypothetical protein